MYIVGNQRGVPYENIIICIALYTLTFQKCGTTFLAHLLAYGHMEVAGMQMVDVHFW